MVDIKASNDKLKLRSIGIVKEFVEKDNEYIKEKLILNDYDVKKTIFMIIKDYSKEDVDKHYDKNITLRKLLEGK
jgi:N-acetylmuramic acid 6-phosphate (MurNAc-6-P) etherase